MYKSAHKRRKIMDRFYFTMHTGIGNFSFIFARTTKPHVSLTNLLSKYIQWILAIFIYNNAYLLK